MSTFVQDDSTQLTTTTITSNISTESVYLLSSTAASTYATITNVNTKENILSFTSPLIRTSNNISIDLSLYDTIALRNSALGSYLPKTGGTLTGPLTTGNITISGTTGRLNVVDDYHYIEFSQSSDITTIQEYGTIKFNIGQTKTTKAYINSSGLTATAFFGNGAGITSLDYNNILTNKPTNFQADWLTTITNKPTIYTQSETNTLLNAKQATLTFSSPLINTSNNITIDLSAYDTIALRNNALGSYLLSSTASSTYATISNLSAKQNNLTFSNPFLNTSNTITLKYNTAQLILIVVVI